MYQFQYQDKFGEFLIKGDRNYVNLSGIINESIKGPIYYLASGPIGKNSFSSGGIPFPNKEIAFNGTINHGEIQQHNGGKFSIQNIPTPNSYYLNEGLDNNLIGPEIMIKYNNGKDDRILRIPLSNSIPYRFQNYPYLRDNDKSNFYKDGWDMPVRTQEQIIRDSQYPDVNKMPLNYWGLKPPS